MLFRLLNRTSFLPENEPLKSLEQLSDTKYTELPKPRGTTVKAFQKVPYLKCSPQAIRDFFIGFVTVATLGNISSQLTHGAYVCSVVNTDKMEKNFFSTTSDCLAQSYFNMRSPDSLESIFFRSSAIVTIGIVSYLAARIFLHDYHANTRFQLLDTQYSKIAKELEKQKDVEKAKHLNANLEAIKNDLKSINYLNSNQVEILIAKLKSAIKNVIAKGEV